MKLAEGKSKVVFEKNKKNKLSWIEAKSKEMFAAVDCMVRITAKK